MIGIVTCYFNPCGYRSRQENFFRFREAVGDSAPLLVVELGTNGYFELPGTLDVIRAHRGDVMWQKERLLQIGIDRLLDVGCDKVIWIDADTIPPEGWLRKIDAALDDFPLVQGFHRIERRFSDLKEVTGGLAHNAMAGDFGGAAGGIMAARSCAIQQAGLYQHCIVGGGDRALQLAALRGHPGWEAAIDRRSLFTVNAKLRRHYLEWADRAAAHLTGVGFIHGTAVSLSHGPIKSRLYDDRHGLLADFDPDADIRCEPGGGWEWATNKPALHAGVHRYFQLRAEDEA